MPFPFLDNISFFCSYNNWMKGFLFVLYEREASLWRPHVAVVTSNPEPASRAQSNCLMVAMATASEHHVQLWSSKLSFIRDFLSPLVVSQRLSQIDFAADAFRNFEWGMMQCSTPWCWDGVGGCSDVAMQLLSDTFRSKQQKMTYWFWSCPSGDY